MEDLNFAEYLTGLMVAGRKNVSAINREFVDATDQSCLNRWLTEADWDVHRLNQLRLDWLQRDPSTRYSEQGVIPFFVLRCVYFRVKLANYVGSRVRAGYSIINE
jgi:hypothetical protein